MPPPGDTPPLRDPRRAGDGRNGAFGSPGDSPMSRAEKFESEKKRIIDTCFSKKDKDGACMWGPSFSPPIIGCSHSMCLLLWEQEQQRG